MTTSNRAELQAQRAALDAQLAAGSKLLVEEGRALLAVQAAPWARLAEIQAEVSDSTFGQQLGVLLNLRGALDGTANIELNRLSALIPPPPSPPASPPPAPAEGQ